MTQNEQLRKPPDMEKENNELKSCPNCKRNTSLTIEPYNEDDWRVFCDKCQMLGPQGATRTIVIQIWNELPRTENPPLVNLDKKELDFLIKAFLALTEWHGCDEPDVENTFKIGAYTKLREYLISEHDKIAAYNRAKANHLYG